MIVALILAISTFVSAVHGAQPLKKTGVNFVLVETGPHPPLPLFAGSREESDFLLGEFPVHMRVFDGRMTDVLHEVQRVHGEVRCDCGLFVQIAAQLLSRSRQPAVLLPPEDNFPEAIACACGRDLAYLRVVNQPAHEKLQSTSFLNKGTWLLPLGEDAYFGLDAGGPRVAEIAEWTAVLREGLACELELAVIPDDEKAYMRDLMKRGITRHWNVDIFSGEWPERHRTDLERILRKARKPEEVQ